MMAPGQATESSPCEVCAAPTTSWRLGSSVLHRCTSCGHLTRSLDEARAYARDHAYGGEPSLDRVRLDLTYRTLTRDAQPSSVFEVGFGPGAMLRKFLDSGAQVSGADPDQLELAVDERVKAQGQLWACGVEDVPAGEVNVDMVFGVHVLEHVVDPLATLKLCRSFLRPGGTAHFLTPAGDWAGLKLVKDGWWMLEDPTHVRFFTAASLAVLAEKAGFEQVEVRRPMLDSIVNDAASLVRRVRPKERPRGVLHEKATLAVAAGLAPMTLGARAVSPRMRPTLHLVAGTSTHGGSR